ncbi:MAG: hypothetical protein ABSF03_21375 [Streptosporangiaceae bacterium]
MDGHPAALAVDDHTVQLARRPRRGVPSAGIGSSLHMPADV